MDIENPKKRTGIRRKEVYARAATQLRTHERAYLAEKKCPGAMGLYLFCLLHARGEETWGDIPDEIVLSAWGGTRAYRRKQADALIAHGLLEHRDGRYYVTKYEEHNDTPDVIEENRAKERTKKTHQRHPTPPKSEVRLVPQVVPRGLPGGAPISLSTSDSGSDLEGEVQEGPPLRLVATAPPCDVPALDAPLPERCRSICEGIAMNTGVELDAEASWTRYVAWCVENGRAVSEARWQRWCSDDASRTRRWRSPTAPGRIVQPAIEGSWQVPEAMP